MKNRNGPDMGGGIMKKWAQGEMSPVNTADHDGMEFMNAKAKILDQQTTVTAGVKEAKAGNPGNSVDKSVWTMADTRELTHTY